MRSSGNSGPNFGLLGCLHGDLHTGFTGLGVVLAVWCLEGINDDKVTILHDTWLEGIIGTRGMSVWVIDLGGLDGLESPCAACFISVINILHTKVNQRSLALPFDLKARHVPCG